MLGINIRRQLRSDLVDLRALSLKVQKSPISNMDSMIKMLEIQMRVLETLGIAAGAYEESADSENG